MMNHTFLPLLLRLPAAAPGVPPVDIAPPTGLIVTLGLGAILVIGVIFAGVIVAAILVIRAVKKRQAPPGK